jgi:hypothetical protein
MADNQPYDPYIPAGGNNGSAGQGGNSRTAALQAVGNPVLSLVYRVSPEPSSCSRSNGMCMGRVLKHRRLGGRVDTQLKFNLRPVHHTCGKRRGGAALWQSNRHADVPELA